MEQRTLLTAVLVPLWLACIAAAYEPTVGMTVEEQTQTYAPGGEKYGCSGQASRPHFSELPGRGHHVLLPQLAPGGAGLACAAGMEEQAFALHIDGVVSGDPPAVVAPCSGAQVINNAPLGFQPRT
jgi:hypothetical protein